MGDRLHDVAVVGAGISGLGTAFWLTRAGLDVVVLEAENEIGGALETWRDGPWLFEQGPSTVLESHTATTDLLRDAGLDDQRLEASPAATRRFLYKGGELVPLPTGPGAALTTSLLPWSAKLRALAEPLIGRGTEERETVADFVRRRFGQPILDYVVDPFVSGTWAGDAERLAVRWALPRLAELERHHGSLIRGSLVERREPKKPGRLTRPTLIGLRHGFSTLASALSKRAGVVRTRHAVRTLVREGEGARARYLLETERGSVAAKRVVIAAPADVTGRLLAEATAGTSRLLEELPYAPVAVVSLGLRRHQVDHPLDGFGFLVPRVEAPRILGCLFPSSLFAGRAPSDHVALTVFLGGRTDPAALELDDRALIGLALDDLATPLGLQGVPVVARVRRWPRAIPQYEVGHERFIECVAQIERDLPGVDLAVNWLNGPSVSDCVRRTKEVACAILQC